MAQSSHKKRRPKPTLPDVLMVPCPRIIDIGSLEELFSEVAADVPVLASPRRGSWSPSWSLQPTKEQVPAAPRPVPEADAVKEHIKAMMDLAAERQRREDALSAAAAVDHGGESSTTASTSSPSAAWREADGASSAKSSEVDGSFSAKPSEGPAADVVQERIRQAAEAARARRRQEAEELQKAGEKIQQAAHEAWERREAASREAEDNARHQQMQLLRQQEHLQLHLQQHLQQETSGQQLQPEDTQQQQQQQQRPEHVLQDDASSMPTQQQGARNLGAEGTEGFEAVGGGCCAWLWEAPTIAAPQAILLEPSPLVTTIWMATPAPEQAWGRLGGARAMPVVPSPVLQQQSPHAAWFDGSTAKVGYDEPFGIHSQWGGS